MPRELPKPTFRRPVAPPPPEPCRLAIAEDDDEIRLALAALLAGDGFEVSYVSDGAELVEFLRESSAEDRMPHLLVLDHRMPRISGLEVLRSLRRAGIQLPFIVMSAFAEEIRAVARARGALAVFDKPFDPDDLRTAIHCLTGRGVPRPPEAREAAPELEAPVCASCGSARRVRREARAGGVTFCAECWDRAAPPGPLDDLGGGD